jgi:hypothetical protein
MNNLKASGVTVFHPDVRGNNLLDQTTQKATRVMMMSALVQQVVLPNDA